MAKTPENRQASFQSKVDNGNNHIILQPYVKLQVSV